MYYKDVIITTYFKCLSVGSLIGVLALFESDAIIRSPIYGKNKADDFYKELFLETKAFEIDVLDIFESVQNKLNWVALVQLDWIMKCGVAHQFECVDVFKFGRHGLIQEIVMVQENSILAQRNLLK